MVGEMEVGELTGFLSYVLQVLNSLMMLSNVFLMLTRGLASWRRIREVLDEEIDITEEQAKEIEVQKGEIEFRDVSFKYQKNAAENVLEHISFHILPGQTFGIIGQTGSAKSTLVQLIPRLYDVTEGQVLVDGHPVQEYPLKGLRDSIAMVLQKNTLFSGTVEENLRMAKPEATEEEMKGVLSRVNLLGFLETWEGLETKLLEQGANLSGGQRQRLALARALLHDTPVYIFDEATSNIDAESEDLIMEVIRELARTRTVLLISHRLSNVAVSDRIYLLDQGKILEQGTHQELMEKQGAYQRLYVTQKNLEMYGKEAKA